MSEGEPPVGSIGDEMDPEERGWLSWVSPHYRRCDFPAEGLTPEQEVVVFADRVWGWQVDVAARLLAADAHADYAVLSIVTSYFEMIGKHLEGFEEPVGESKAHFLVGFRDVFSERPPEETTRIGERLYEAVRCGLYHDAITGAGIAVSGRDDPRVLAELPDPDGGVELMLSPGGILDRVRLHFASYVGELLAEPESDKRERFLRRFHAVHGAPGSAPKLPHDGRQRVIRDDTRSARSSEKRTSER